ncbi:MAG: hypothetical protein ACYCU7_13690 [Acidimicrobiales bacterium]
MTVEPTGALGTDRPALTLDEAAVVAGRYGWIEGRLFELTGSWAAAVPSPTARVLLDAASLEHAWHAELWGDRLPVLDGADHDALTCPTPTLVRLFDAADPDAADAADPDHDGGWVARLAGLFRVVLPRLLVGYRRHLSLAAPVADGPTIRALRLTVRDELDEWQAGEALLQELLAGRPMAAASVAETQQRLENILVSGGIGSGLVPWPASSTRSGVPPGPRWSGDRPA